MDWVTVLQLSRRWLIIISMIMIIIIASIMGG